MGRLTDSVTKCIPPMGWLIEEQGHNPLADQITNILHPTTSQYASDTRFNHLNVAASTLSAETRSEVPSVASAKPSNLVGDGSGAEGVDEGLADVGHYQTVVPHVAASHSNINYVQSDQTNITNIIYHESSSNRDKIRQWLSPTIPSKSYDEALKLRLQDTGMWIVRDERFSEWKDSADSLLWLYGKPGCGKTVICSSIIEDISLLCNASSVMAYGYSFFDAMDSRKNLQYLDHLVISLIWQFSEQYETFPKALNDLYDSCNSGSHRPSMESLHRTLLLVLDSFHHVYLILDALDECTERIKLLKWIDEISRWKVGKVHVLVTSRQEPDIQKALRSLDPILICLEGEFVERDIMSYLDWMLRDDKNRKRWDHDTRYKIKSSLLQGAQGMFRWVPLQLDELRRCRSRRQVEQQLRRLPKDLYESYDRIIRRIDERDREDVLELLRRLAFYNRPVELDELAKVAVDVEPQDLPEFDRPQWYDDVDILEMCSGLVSITDGCVKLAHFTVKEYLFLKSALEAGVGESSQKTILLTDFIGRQVNIPLELCKSWPILCEFLSILLRGEKESLFITTQKFGLLVPDQVDLLHGETWDSWVTPINQGVGTFPITVDLYAIIDDDSNSCPRCKRLDPATKPLPLGQNVQQCFHCNFTFLELYQEVGSNEPGGASAKVERPLQQRLVSEDTPGQSDSATVPSEPTNIHEPVPDRLLTRSPQVPQTRATSQTQMILDSGPVLPMHVQVVRRRKPFRHEERDPDLPTDQYPPTALRNDHQTILPCASQTRPNSLDVLHALYMHILFCLPDRCRRDAPSISPRRDSFPLRNASISADSEHSGGDDSSDAFCRDWQTFCETVMGEWFQAGSAASVLFATLFTVLQISSAADDPITRTVVQLSIVCLFFGVIYSCILWTTFRRLKFKHKGLAWVHEATGTPRNSFWNLWVMLSMPLAWILWGVIYFTMFLMVFLWRSGASDEPDEKTRLAPKQAYGPRVVTTLIFVAGVVYFVLIFFTVRKI